MNMITISLACRVSKARREIPGDLFSHRARGLRTSFRTINGGRVKKSAFFPRRRCMQIDVNARLLACSYDVDNEAALWTEIAPSFIARRARASLPAIASPYLAVRFDIDCHCERAVAFRDLHEAEMSLVSRLDCAAFD